MKIQAKVELSAQGHELLTKLPQIITKNEVAGKALREGGKIVLERAKSLTPRGDPAHRKDKKALVETEAVVIRPYQSTVVAFVGPQYPAGAHGHLVEFGHRIVTRGKKATKGRAKATPFLQPAIDTTQQQVEDAIVRVISAEIEKQIGGNLG